MLSFVHLDAMFRGERGLYTSNGPLISMPVAWVVRKLSVLNFKPINSHPGACKLRGQGGV